MFAGGRDTAALLSNAHAVYRTERSMYLVREGLLVFTVSSHRNSRLMYCFILTKGPFQWKSAVNTRIMLSSSDDETRYSFHLLTDPV